MEAKAIKTDFQLAFDYAVVPNAIDLMFAKRDDSFSRRTGLIDYVLCVGNYIERKNQLALIEALKGLGLPLVLVGSVVPTHRNYFQAVQAAAARADFPVKIFEHITQQELVSYYSGAKVVTLPSWIETTGLAGLEGGLAGCNVVITDRGYTKEYFRDLAFYCSPDNIPSIRQAVRQAYDSARNQALVYQIKSKFTWEKTAQATFKAYQKALEGTTSKH
jgi:glycosyltransferase involved in cell wall biosynthesis